MTDGVSIAVRVTSRSSRDAVEGPGDDGILRVRVTAAPVDGAANRAVVKLMASALGVPKSRISVVAGVSSRNKRLQVAGIDAGAIETQWPGIRPGSTGRR